ILIARDLRKAGLDVGHPRRRALDALTAGDGEAGADGFRLALSVDLATPEPATLLVICRSSPEPVDRDAVEGLAASVLKERERSDGSRLAGALVAAAFAQDAVTAASDSGVALLRVADARASFDATGYGPRGHYPMWLPEYVLEVPARDAAGLPTFTMLGQGDGARLLAALGLED
ncbi:MAG TPA: hypothetical protein VK966_03235, partial [Longimicrobiales bacterium]|nr:hypothetical protein [Longimicrobiales bacterium]